MKTLYVCPYRKSKWDFGTLAAFFLCRVDRATSGHESIIIYMNEWENQGGE